jgi:type II secretory pathway component PulF
VLTAKSQALFFRQLGAVSQAGIGLGQGIRLSSRDIAGRKRADWERVSLGLDRGLSLQEALKPVQTEFSPLAIAMLQIAEESGAIALVCQNLGDVLEEMGDHDRLVRGMIFRLWGMFWGLGMVLYLLLGGTFLSGAFLLVSIIWLLILVSCTYGISKIPAIQAVCRQVIPPLRHLAALQTQINLIYIQLPLDCGISTSVAVDWMRTKFPDPQLKPIFQKIAPKIRHGMSLSQSLDKKLSPMVVQMMRTGEEVGTLSTSFEQIRAYAQQDFRRKLALLSLQVKIISLLSFGCLVLVAAAQSMGNNLQNLPGVGN